MLNKKSITPQQVFSVPNINGDIRQNIQTFLTFCSRRREFTVQMFDICFNSHYKDLQDQKKQKVAQYTIEALSNDEDALSQFLFNENQTIKNSSQVSETIEEQPVDSIESEALRLFGSDSQKQIEQKWTQQPQVFEKYELVKLSLKHLKQEQKNQTCLGYIHKIYASILRRQGKCFLEFFQNNQEYLKLFFDNIQYPSISNIIALCLSSQDKSGQYRHQQLKKQIFSKLLDCAFNNLANQSSFQGFMMTVEEIFNSTKQSYYEYFEDFKRCANTLVSYETLNKFFQALKNQNQRQFSHSASYMQLVIRRINNEVDQNDYYRQQDNSEPSMKFQHQFLFKQLSILFHLLETSSSYNSLTRVSYLCFLINLMKNQKNNEGDLNNVQLFKLSMKYYFAEKSKGMIKNYLYQLLDLIIKRMNPEQMAGISKWITDKQNIDINVDQKHRSSSIEINQDRASCYILSIIFQIQNKQKGFIKDSSLQNQDLLHQTNQKYSTRLADCGQDSPFQLQFVIPKRLIEQDTDKKQQKQKQNDSEREKQKQKQKQKQTHIGKNNILIPSLNLPNRNQNVKVHIEEQTVQPFEFSKEPSRQSIIQDLKNTIIQLPSKFKIKQKTQTSSQPQKKQQQQPIEVPEIKTKNKNPEGNLKKDDKIPEKISNFYIRHLILF